MLGVKEAIEKCEKPDEYIKKKRQTPKKMKTKMRHVRNVNMSEVLDDIKRMDSEAGKFSENGKARLFVYLRISIPVADSNI